MSPCKTGEYPSDIAQSSKPRVYLKDNKHNSLHLARKYAWIFVSGHYLFLKAHSFPQASSRKTVRFSEQVMSAYKYSSIFSSQMETKKKETLEKGIFTHI